MHSVGKNEMEVQNGGEAAELQNVKSFARSKS